MTEEAADPAAQPAAAEASGAATRPRRRRRGGRGRGRGGSATRATAAKEAEPKPAEAESPQGAAPATPKTTTARRRPRGTGPSKAAGQKEPSGRSRAATPGTGEAEPAKPSRARRRRPAKKPDEPAESKSASGTAGAEVAEGEAPQGAEAGEGAPKRRRRRRRRRSSGSPVAPDADTTTEAEPKRKQEPTRPADRKAEEPKAPPTRTRSRRKLVGARRRREPVVHAERRTDKTMLLTRHRDREQIAVVEGRELMEHYVTRSAATSMVGNIYLGRVQNVLPGMEAAFVDVGRGRNAVLYAGEVSYAEDVDSQERRIEQALKAGQSVLVQVTKDPMGGKGARLTGQISLAGRYLVYVPAGGVSGLSRRLPLKERTRLKDILKKIRPSEEGVIVRTAAEGASEEDLAADLDRLKKSWESIKRRSRRAKPATLLYEEPELTVRVVRDVFSPAEFKEIVTDDREIYDKIIAYLQDVGPELIDRVRFHDGPLPVLEEYNVEEQIHKALERKVWLPSGGYVIIDRTEAMTVIDVNTGKHVGKTNLEETVVATNLEAAREIARQLRLRDIGGIIVIDFIDMLLATNRERIIQALSEELAHDKTRSQVFDITPIGLLEVTRKKVSAGLLESFSETCPTCEGRGILLTHSS